MRTLGLSQLEVGNNNAAALSGAGAEFLLWTAGINFLTINAAGDKFLINLI